MPVRTGCCIYHPSSSHMSPVPLQFRPFHVHSFDVGWDGGGPVGSPPLHRWVRWGHFPSIDGFEPGSVPLGRSFLPVGRARRWFGQSTHAHVCGCHVPIAHIASLVRQATMYREEYQSGFFSVLYSIGRNPLESWAQKGACVRVASVRGRKTDDQQQWSKTSFLSCQRVRGMVLHVPGGSVWGVRDAQAGDGHWLTTTHPCSISRTCEARDG